MSRRSSIMIQRSYYQIALITFIIAIMWVLLSVYNALTSVSDVGVDATILSPLQVQIDETTVASIAGRTQLSQTAPAQVEGITQVLPSASPTVVTINEVVEVPTDSEIEPIISPALPPTTTTQ